LKPDGMMVSKTGYPDLRQDARLFYPPKDLSDQLEETIADMVHGPDVGGMMGVALDLPAEVADVGIQRAFGAVAGMRPGLLEQFPAGIYVAGIFHEQSEQGEFSGGQFNRFVADRQLAAAQVDGQVAAREAQWLVGLSLFPAQQRLDTRHQFARIERLGDVIIRPQVQAFRKESLPTGGRHHQDWEGCQLRFKADLPSQAPTGVAGDVRVQDQQVGSLAPEHVHPHFRIGGGQDTKISPFQLVTYLPPGVELIFDNQYQFHRAHNGGMSSPPPQSYRTFQ
jgi:hypothetical protein